MSVRVSCVRSDLQDEALASFSRLPDSVSPTVHLPDCTRAYDGSWSVDLAQMLKDYAEEFSFVS
jgi:hypothetical protein